MNFQEQHENCDNIAAKLRNINKQLQTLKQMLSQMFSIPSPLIPERTLWSVNVSREFDLTVHNNLKLKRDKFSNCTWKLMLKWIANYDTLIANRTLTCTQPIAVKYIIFHSKTKRKHSTADPTLHKKSMIFVKETQYHEFYCTKL